MHCYLWSLPTWLGIGASTAIGYRTSTAWSRWPLVSGGQAALCACSVALSRPFCARQRDKQIRNPDAIVAKVSRVLEVARAAGVQLWVCLLRYRSAAKFARNAFVATKSLAQASAFTISVRRFHPPARDRCTSSLKRCVDRTSLAS
jgi:hypothetical protein